MATFDLDENNATYQIKAYQPGTIQVNDRTLTKSIIIAPNTLIDDWAPQTMADLTSQSFNTILQMKPDILLIGTGSTHEFLTEAIYGDLINHGIGVEIMSTSAACRTYNALSAEGRNVIAALLIK
jgi:uncharacterized protein